MITLSEPVQAHGKDLTHIEFRKPNGGDVRACGYPFSMTPNDDGSMTIHPQAGPITALIARLGNIPPSSAAALSMPDWNACMAEVLGFFGQSVQPTADEALSNGASTSPGSGNGIRR